MYGQAADKAAVRACILSPNIARITNIQHTRLSRKLLKLKK